MQMRVDLNADVGESFGIYKLGLDEQVMGAITSANIACGFHAGDPMVMKQTVDLALAHHVGIGAHPGYPDLQGFGRRNMSVKPEEVEVMVIYQVGALKAFVEGRGARLQHVKAHGSMYNMAAKDRDLADAIAHGVKAAAPEAILLGLANSELIRAGKRLGLRVAQEVFADRAYNPDGSLVPRGEPGAMVHDPEIALPRVTRMVTEGKVTTITGEDIPLKADSICVHGDNPKALRFTREIKEVFNREGIHIQPMGA